MIRYSPVDSECVDKIEIKFRKLCIIRRKKVDGTHTTVFCCILNF